MGRGACPVGHNLATKQKQQTYTHTVFFSNFLYDLGVSLSIVNQ